MHRTPHTPVLDADAGERCSWPSGAGSDAGRAVPARRCLSPTGSATGSGGRGSTGDRAGRPVPAPRGAGPIAYGYLRAATRWRDYQTIFAADPGSAEMPSAGRPFTPDWSPGWSTAGVAVAPITLHTGVSSQDAGEAPQAEWFAVPASTAELVNATRARGRPGDRGRHHGDPGAGKRGGRGRRRSPRRRAGPTWSSTPGRGVRVVDGLITGWHNPEASHLLLVEAVAGSGLTQRAYDAAVAEDYLWHEFGDAGLLLPH